MSKILALDQSLTCFGCAVAESCNGGYSLRAWTYRPPGPTAHPGKRLAQIADWLIDTTACNYDLLVMEAYSYTANSAASSGLHELGGIIRYVAYACQLPLLIVNPSTRSKYALGGSKKNADTKLKDAVLLAARERYGKIITGNDIADAVILADIGFHVYESRDGDNAVRRQVLDALRSQVTKP